MKPTSIIFLVFSLILFVGGFFMCRYAEKKAESDNLPIYDITVNEDGSTFYSYPLDDSAISSLKLVFNGADVTVKTTTGESRVELNNFGATDYSVTLSGTSVTVDGTVSTLESFIDRSDGGIQFRGFRYFLLDKPDESLEKSVTLYLSENSKLNSLTLSVENGNLSVSDIDGAVDYSVYMTNGDVTLKNISTLSVVEFSVENGNVTAESVNAATFIATVNGGSVKTVSNGAFAQDTTSYDITVNEGSLIYNGSPVEDNSYKITQTVEKNLIRINVTGGTVNVSDLE